MGQQHLTPQPVVQLGSCNINFGQCKRGSMMFWQSFRKGHEAQGLRSLRRCASDANFLIETSLHINNDGRLLSFSENQFFAKAHRPPLSTDFLPPLRTRNQGKEPFKENLSDGANHHHEVQPVEGVLPKPHPQERDSERDVHLRGTCVCSNLNIYNIHIIYTSEKRGLSSMCVYMYRYIRRYFDVTVSQSVSQSGRQAGRQPASQSVSQWVNRQTKR